MGFFLEHHSEENILGDINRVDKKLQKKILEAVEKTKNNNDFNFEDSRNSRKSVIQENFGADINYSDFDEDKPKRKKGKHF